jgi:hypothetical protein
LENKAKLAMDNTLTPSQPIGVASESEFMKQRERLFELDMQNNPLIEIFLQKWKEFKFNQTNQMDLGRFEPRIIPSFLLAQFLQSQGINPNVENEEFQKKINILLQNYDEELAALDRVGLQLKVEISQIKFLDEHTKLKKLMEIDVQFSQVKVALRSDLTETIPALVRQYNIPKKRPKFTDDAKAALKKWYLDHLERPYPTDQEKQDLAIATCLTTSQVSVWFYNERARSKSRNHH